MSADGEQGGVTQADRNAAAKLFGKTDWSYSQFVTGKRDKDEKVLAFMRHRVAHAAPATNTQDVVRDALLISRDTMSRAADLVENAYGWTGEANRLRRSADCCRAALAACQAEARGPIHETECWSTKG